MSSNKEPKQEGDTKQTTQGQQQESSESTTSSSSNQQPSPENSNNNLDVKKLKEENANLLEKVKEIDDKFKRALADTENTRIRMRKQIEEAKVFGIQNFCKDLLDVADVLDKAIEFVPPEEVGKSEILKNLFTGVDMTSKQLQGVFRRHGLLPINPIGQKFNPNEHHALFEADDPGKEPGTVAVVTKIGYKLHERTIRPAMVGVVKASSATTKGEAGGS